MNVVIKVNEETKEKMLDYYKDKMRDKKPPYSVFQAVDEDTVITMYESGKVMFQGKSADVDASHWGVELANTKEEKKKEKEKSIYYNTNSVGSDEVGTGDYFGPIIVTATYVPKEAVSYLEKLGVRDSKKIEDDKIKEIAPIIASKIKYRSVILTNKEYNERYKNGETNINEMKARLHNKALYQLVNEEKPKYDYIIMDEFAREARYYSYLNGIDKVQRDITFVTKAEDKNMAVACGAIISRYLLIKYMDNLQDKLHVPIPKGSGESVDKAGEEIVDKYGKEILEEIAKLNFKNTQRILHTMVY